MSPLTYAILTTAILVVPLAFTLGCLGFVALKLVK